MSDQNNQQGSTSPANIAGRKIAVPRRRLARAASSDGASNPMAGFSFGITGAPSGQAGFTATTTSAFGNQPQPSPPAFGRSFSEAGGFQANMAQQQQQQPIDSSAPSSPSATGFTFGSKTGFTFPANKPSTDFQFGSASPSAPANQPTSFSFGTTPVSSTTGGGSTTSSSQPGFSFGNQSAMTPLGGFKPSSAFGGSTMDEDAMDKDEAPAEKPTAFLPDISSSESSFASTGANTSGFSFPASSSTSSGFTFPAKEPSSSGFTFGGSSTSFKFPTAGENISFKLPSAGESTGSSFSAATTTAAGFGTTTQSEQSTAATTPSSTAVARPTFSFGTTSQPDQSTTATTSSSAAVARPTFSFGTGTAQTTLTSTPAFGFGRPSAAPTLSFGTPAASKESELESTKTPATGLKVPTVVAATDEETTEPAEKKGAESSAPKFSFGTTTSSASNAKPAPTFSFGSAFQTKPQETAVKDADSDKATTSKPADAATIEEVVKKTDEEKGKEAEKSDDKATESEDGGETTKDVAEKKEEAPKGVSSDSTDTKSSSDFFNSSSFKSSGELPTSQSIAIPTTPTFSIAATASTTKKGTEAVDKGTSSFMLSSSAKPDAQASGLSTPAFGGSALTVTPSSSASETSAPAPAFSFGTGTQPSTSQAPTFSFGQKSTFAFDKDASSNTSTASSSTTTAPATPAFSFGTAGASTAKPATGTTSGPSPFVFPSASSTPSASAAKDQSKEKAAAPSPFTASATTQPATSSISPQPGTAFTFGATSTAQSDRPATATSTPASGPSPFSFGAPAPQENTSSTSESSKKRKSNEQISSVESSRQKFVHGKSPLSQSWSAEEGGNKTPTLVSGLSGAIPPRKRSVDSAGMVPPATSAPEKKVLTDVQNKENRPAEKHVSFKLPDGSKSEDKGKSVDKPELISPFKPLQSKPIEIPSSQAPLSALKSQSTSSDVIGLPSATKAEQTVLDSKIGNPESIEKRTRYRDLPDTAQNELNLVYQFIEDQINIAKKIETRQLAHNGELLSEVEGYADRCTKELRLHNQSLTMTKENLHDLASAADYQVQNAMVAQLFFDNTSVHGRSSTGTTIHQRYFADLADSLHERCGNYRTAINQLEERVDTMMRGNENASPDHIPAIIQSQSQTLMGLTAKVSDLHQEVEKMKRNYQTLR